MRYLGPFEYLMAYAQENKIVLTEPSFTLLCFNGLEALEGRYFANCFHQTWRFQTGMQVKIMIIDFVCIFHRTFCGPFIIYTIFCCSPRAGSDRIPRTSADFARDLQLVHHHFCILQKECGKLEGTEYSFLKKPKRCAT